MARGGQGDGSKGSDARRRSMPRPGLFAGPVLRTGWTADSLRHDRAQDRAESLSKAGFAAW